MTKGNTIATKYLLSSIIDSLFLRQRYFSLAVILLVCAPTFAQFQALNNITFSDGNFRAVLSPESIKIEGEYDRFDLKIQGKKVVLQSANRKYYSFLNYKIISLKGINSVFYFVTDEKGRKLFSDSLNFVGDLPHPLFKICDTGELIWVSPYNGKGEIIGTKGRENIQFFSGLTPIEERKVFISNENSLLSIAVTKTPPAFDTGEENVALTLFSLENRTKTEYTLRLKNISGLNVVNGIIIATGSLVNYAQGNQTTFTFSATNGLSVLTEGKSSVLSLKTGDIISVNNAEFKLFGKNLAPIGKIEAELPSNITEVNLFGDFLVVTGREAANLYLTVYKFQSGQLTQKYQREPLPFGHNNGAVITGDGLFLFGDNQTVLFKQK